MLKSGGAVIPMQQALAELKFEVGNLNILENMEQVPVKSIFENENINFLNTLSKKILSMERAKLYPDVITFGFWCRRAFMSKERELYHNSKFLQIGRGIVFHIAPSNVAVNYAYSFVTGFITGNANIVRIPSKYFEQVDIINEAIRQTLTEFPQFIPYICFVRYGHNQELNDYFSRKCSVRVIWGGNQTIAQIRTSTLKPRAKDITFADRYSLCVIQAEDYLRSLDQDKIAQNFYNDTFLSDQNACTSPKVIVWTGEHIEEAKQIFWAKTGEIVLQKKYELQPVQAVNKLTAFYHVAAANEGILLEERKDNLIFRVRIEKLTEELIMENSGYFYEYETQNIKDIMAISGEMCQTVSYVGNLRDDLLSIVKSGIRGIDRVVPIGKTMDFNFIWDGYNLIEEMSRTVKESVG